MKTGKYSQREIDYLCRAYPRYGYKHCAKYLGREPKNVHMKAFKLGLRVGEIKGFMPLLDAARASRLNYLSLYNAAKNSGQITYFGKDIRQVPCATTEWLDRYIKAETERQFNEENYGHWLESRQVCKILNVGFGTLQRAISENYGFLKDYAKKLEVKEGLRGRWLFNPESVEIVRAELEALRAKSKGMKFAKSYWLENDPDLNRSTSLARLRKKAKTKRVMKNGRWQIVYKEAA